MMHLTPPYLTTTRYNHKKKKSAKQLKAEIEHAEWLKQKGLDKSTVKTIVAREKPQVELPTYEYTKVKYSNVVGNGTKSGIMENLHNEPEHVRNAILEKAKRLAPAYSKGAYQYITPGSDVVDLGKKK